MVINRDKVLDVFAVLWIILSSNSLVYCILNMRMSMAVLGAIAILYLLKNGCVNKKNFNICVTICSIVALNLLINYEYTSINENIFILLIRLFSLMIIMSNISSERFMEYFVKILLVLSVISIVCFGFSVMWGNMTLPFQTTITYNGKYYIYTFYHTLGRWKIFERNAGIFWEPGGFQIFLNFALLFLLVKPRLFLEKWSMRQYIVSIVVIVATILTTMSTTGFICMALVLIIGILHGDTDTRTKRILTLVIILALVVFAIVENQMGIIQSKAIDQEGSFDTRYNDTIVSFSLGLDRLFGYGYANTYTPNVLASNGVTDNSNGLGGFMICFGLPLTIVYLVYTWFRMKHLLEAKTLESILEIAVYIMFIMTENVYAITLFLSFLFVWNESEQEELEYYNEGD